jgi:hypothetical protein
LESTKKFDNSKIREKNRLSEKELFDNSRNNIYQNVKKMNQEEKQTGQQTVINEMETTEQNVTEETIHEEATTDTTEEVITEEDIAEEMVSEEDSAAEKTDTEGTDTEGTDTEGTDTEGTVAEEVDPEPDIITDFRQSETFTSLSESDQEAVGQWLDQLVIQLNQHSLTADSLQAVLHAIHYDRDVAQAGIDGEVRGRNTRIEDMFEQRRKAADIHVLGGAAQPTSPTLPPHILGGLSAADRQTIWERGNERRVKNN